jgi:DNA polymerase-3 subunit delta'
MSFSDNFGESWESVLRTHAEGRLAHAYLISGAPRGDGLAFAEAMLQLVLCTGRKPPCNECDGCRRVRAHTHPDVEFIEPESKSRVIRIDEKMRPLLQHLSQTSYLGGWKAGVVLFADRLNESSGNAFLKTLEEPAPRTLLLLVSDQPQAVLTTLRSRCQMIVVSRAESEPEGEWREPLLALLRKGCGPQILDRLAHSASIRAILDAVRKKIMDQEAAQVEDAADEPPGEEDESAVETDVLKARIQSQVLRVRSDLLRLALLWHRDVMVCAHGAGKDLLHFSSESATLKAQAARLSPDEALTNVRLIEELARRLERGILDAPAFDRFLIDLQAR